MQEIPIKMESNFSPRYKSEFGMLVPDISPGNLSSLNTRNPGTFNFVNGDSSVPLVYYHDRETGLVYEIRMANTRENGRVVAGYVAKESEGLISKHLKRSHESHESRLKKLDELVQVYAEGMHSRLLQRLADHNISAEKEDEKRYLIRGKAALRMDGIESFYFTKLGETAPEELGLELALAGKVISLSWENIYHFLFRYDHDTHVFC